MSWEEIKQGAAREGVPVRLVAMQALHLALLDALYQQSRSVGLVFHGGTCIRLVYGGYRYSEDLDFVSTLDDEGLNALLARTETRLRTTLPVVLGFGVMSISSKERRPGWPVRKWWIRFQRGDAREVIRVKVEIGSFPARCPVTAALPARPMLPALVPLVVTVPVDELLADKVNALAQRAFLRGRDLFDIWFLREARSAVLRRDLVLAKFSDYGTKQPFEVLARRLEEMSPEAIRAEMKTLLPRPQRSLLEAAKYLPVLESARAVINEVLTWR